MTNRIMNEYIHLPGFGTAFVVTRHYAWQWLRSAGVSKDRVDFAVMSPRAIPDDLTEMGPHQDFLDEAAADLRRMSA